MRPQALLPVLLSLAAAPAAQRPASPPPEPAGLRAEQPFPLRIAAPFGDFGLELAVNDGARPAAADALPADRRVRFDGVPWPGPRGVETIALEVERWQALSSDVAWFVNGERAGGRGDLEAHVRLYSGRVAGEPDSHAYLALTTTGTWGWIRRGAERVHLFSAPSDGDWSRTRAFLLHERDSVLPDAPGFACEARVPGGGVSQLAPAPGGATQGASRAGRVWECRMALETDYQFYQLFNDVQAATNYAVSLFGALSERFLSAADTFVTLPYLGIYSDPNDPWLSQDNGGSSGNVLDEFRLAWGGQPLPGNANLAHLISGANLGGGVAYVDTLCNTSYGFAVSGNLHGMISFPVQQVNNLNWDIFVAAHETGHNFGSPHTHDYCPPVDECPSSFGACQTQQLCVPGTIMSYCHGCPGGMGNVRMDFHPTVSALLRQRVQASCLTSYPPAAAVVRNGLGGNPLGYQSWSAPQLGSTWWATVDLQPAGGLVSVIAAVAAPPTQGVIQSFGEVLIRIYSSPLAVPLLVGNGLHLVPIPNSMSLLGLTLTTQAAVLVPGSFELQNALDLTFGL